MATWDRRELARYTAYVGGTEGQHSSAGQSAEGEEGHTTSTEAETGARRLKIRQNRLPESQPATVAAEVSSQPFTTNTPNADALMDVYIRDAARMIAESIDSSVIGRRNRADDAILLSISHTIYTDDLRRSVVVRWRASVGDAAAYHVEALLAMERIDLLRADETRAYVVGTITSALTDAVASAMSRYLDIMVDRVFSRRQVGGGRYGV